MTGRSPAHGSVLRYDQGCTCSRCVLRAAERDHERRYAMWEANARRMSLANIGQRRPRNRSLAPHELSSHTLKTGELAVDCWCRRRVVYVVPEVVRACRTESCGQPGCSEDAVA